MDTPQPPFYPVASYLSEQGLGNQAAAGGLLLLGYPFRPL